jgi:hypothetical protein
VIRKRQTRCLPPQTLAALVRGKIPVDEVEHVRKHLPQCSKCLGRLTAGIQRRTPGARVALAGGSPPVGVESSHGKLFRSLAVALSLLALGSSATCWYLDPPVPGKSSPLQPRLPSDVTRNALTGGME